MKFAIAGFGVVGSGVAEVFYKNRAAIEQKAGCSLDLKYIVDLKSLAGSPYANKATTNFDDALNDPEVGLIVETMGGQHPALEFSQKALRAKKHVVTSNKELVATHGAALLALAKENDVNYLFEASVGGGIPVLHPLYQCLGGGDITEVCGILNGTTNFIMTRMFTEGMSFADALALAQKNGYAEQDPTADIEGHDACRKICILGSMVYGTHIYPEEVHTEGISAITAQDVATAATAGYAIKLIGRVRRTKDGVLAMVSPALVSKQSMLGNVSDVFNAVMVRGSDLGDVLFYGKGAGKAPTASAVLSDVIDAVRAGGNISILGWCDGDHHTLCDYLLDETPLLLRVARPDEKAAQQLFGLAKAAQGSAQEAAFFTPSLAGGAVQKKLAQAKKDGITVLSALRVLDY